MLLLVHNYLFFNPFFIIDYCGSNIIVRTDHCRFLNKLTYMRTTSLMIIKIISGEHFITADHSTFYAPLLVIVV